MPSFTIRTVNNTFRTATTVDRPDAADALRYGVTGAMRIAADEIDGGRSVAAVEVVVDGASGFALHRVVITTSVAPLGADATGPLPAGSIEG